MKRSYKISLMMLLVCVLIGFTHIASAQNSYNVYFNELRVDDAGTDNIEFIELIAPAGINLSGFIIRHFDGAAGVTGVQWTHTIGSFTVIDDGVTSGNGTPLGFFVLGAGGNNDPGVDETNNFTFPGQTGGLLNTTAGLVLYDPSNNIVDAIAWGSAGDLVSEVTGLTTAGDPGANNYLAVTSSLNNDNGSLGAPSSVFNDPGAGWEAGTATVGSLNDNQNNGEVSLPVQLSSFSAIPGDKEVTLNWVTESEVNNMQFDVLRADERDGDYILIGSREGQYNTNQRTEYTFTDNAVDNGNTYWYKLEDVDLNGVRTTHGPISATPGLPDAAIPNNFKLYQNFPNPFNPQTTLEVFISGNQEQSANIVVEIFNVLGQKVKTVYDGNLQSGTHQFTWSGDNEAGAAVPGGIYYAVLTAGSVRNTIKMVLLK